MTLDDKINSKLEEGRYNELVDLFKQLIDVSKSESEKEKVLIQLVQKNTLNVESFLSKLKNVINTRPTPQIEVNVDKVADAVTDSKTALLNTLTNQNELIQQLINVRKATVQMTAVDYDLSGRIKTVEVKLINK